MRNPVAISVRVFFAGPYVSLRAAKPFRKKSPGSSARWSETVIASMIRAETFLNMK